MAAPANYRLRSIRPPRGARTARDRGGRGAELAVTRERLDQAELRAGEAEHGRLEAVTRLDALRAAWWRWYALAQARPWWRRRLPDAPAELTAGPALAKPVDG